MRTRFRSLICGLVVAALFVLVPGAARAQVVVSFHGHEALDSRGATVTFPHAFIRLSGTIAATGEAVDRYMGYSPTSFGPQLLMGPVRGLVDEPNGQYLHEAKLYASVVISDETYRAILDETGSRWARETRPVYDLRRRNCIHYVATIAQLTGLTVPPIRDAWSPNGFLTDLATANAVADPFVPMDLRPPVQDEAVRDGAAGDAPVETASVPQA